MNNLEYILHELDPPIQKIKYHPLYSQVNTIANLKIFMENHVFAVWDFMCLLKELHRRLVSTSAPWFPPKDALSSNLISSILVEEEGDIDEDGINYASHFEIYITAMDKIGADSNPIKKFLGNLKNGKNIQESSGLIKLEPAVYQFIEITFNSFNLKIHELAAYFVFGREAITTPMFTPMLKDLEKLLKEKNMKQLSTLIYYFKRHIELDDEDHYPKALKMIGNLTGSSDEKWSEVLKAAKTALEARIKFLDSINKKMISRADK